MKLHENNVVKIYTDYMESRHFSAHTVDVYTRTIRDFFRWLEIKQNKKDIRDSTEDDILDYTGYLRKAQKNGKQRYARNTRRAKLYTLERLFIYLYTSEYILVNPFELLDLSGPREDSKREAVPEEALSKVLDTLDTIDILDVRDSTLIELLYGTGLRVGEVSRLNLEDVDFQKGVLFIQQGKWSKDRYVPLGNHLRLVLKRYISFSRNHLLKQVKDTALHNAFFFSIKGKRISIAVIENQIKKRFRDGGYRKTVTPHMLRHSFATHMLNSGASIKHVKDILGHSSYQTTVNYTHFTIHSLKKIMKQYHPLENELYRDFEAECDKLGPFFRGK